MTYMKMTYINICFLALIASLLVPGGFGNYVPKDVTKKSKFEDEKLLSTNIAIQGIVYCRSASKLIPVEGALTRITCEAVDEYGVQTTPFTFLSESNWKGYFLAMLSPHEVAEKRVLKECMVFLDASPLDNCIYGTDFNKGISGASLHSHRYLNDKSMKLYTVGPFVFTSSPTSISDGY